MVKYLWATSLVSQSRHLEKDCQSYGFETYVELRSSMASCVMVLAILQRADNNRETSNSKFGGRLNRTWG